MEYSDEQYFEPFQVNMEDCVVEVSEVIKLFNSFLTQKGISIKITGFGISKKICGIKYILLC